MMRFNQSDTIWAEVTTLIEPVTARWQLDRRLQGMMVPKPVFMGTLCKYLTLDNKSQLDGVLAGYRVMEECSLTETSHCPGGSTDYLLPHDNPYVHRLQQVFMGHSYHKLLPDIEAKWTKDLSKWDDLLNYARHIRNGCFHGNQFHFFSNPKPVIWRGFEISAALEGHAVMGITKGCFGVADIIALLYDLQRLINK